MDDKEVVKLGKQCGKLFYEAWELRKQIDTELLSRFGFDSVDAFEDETGLDFENDILIDCLEYGSGGFTMKLWKMALDTQKYYIENRS